MSVVGIRKDREISIAFNGGDPAGTLGGALQQTSHGGMCAWKPWSRFFAAERHHDRKSSPGCRSGSLENGLALLSCMVYNYYAEVSRI